MLQWNLPVFLRASMVAPLFAPTIGAAAAKSNQTDDFGLLAETRKVRGHGTAGGMAEADDFTSGQVLVRQSPGPLEYDVKGAFQVAVSNFFLIQLPIQEIDRHAFGNGNFPHASRRVMAWIGEREDFESLGSGNPRQTRPPVRRQVHDLFTARSAVKKHQSSARIGFLRRRVQRAVHVPVVPITLIANGDIGAVKVSVRVGWRNGQPFIPGE